MARRKGDETLAFLYEWVEYMPELQTSHDTCTCLEYRGEPNPATANQGVALTLSELFGPLRLTVSEVAKRFAAIGHGDAIVPVRGTKLAHLNWVADWESQFLKYVWFNENQEVAQLLADLLARPVYMYSKERGEPEFKASYRAFPSRDALSA